MSIVMMILVVAVYCLAVLVTSLAPIRSQYSVYERTRRHKAGSKAMVRDMQREKFADSIAGMLRTKSTLLQVLFVLLALVAFGWAGGAVVSVMGLLCCQALARVPSIHRIGQRLYARCELPLLGFIEQYQLVGRFFRTLPSDYTGQRPIASREELAVTVERLPAWLSKDEKQLLLHGLGFADKTAESAMTPRSMLQVVEVSDMVGPLMLDELHKTGHSRFPVVEADVDHVVGILHIQDLLLLHDKKTRQARDLMTSPVRYINQTQTLDTALAAFLSTHQHMFIVVNEYRETVGVLTLEDTIEALIGRKIVDEFDVHEDLRAVAARNPRGNNTPAQHADI